MVNNIKRTFLLSMALGLFMLQLPQIASAQTALKQPDIDAIYQNWPNWVAGYGGCGSTTTTSPGGTNSNSNLDYAGRPILTQAQLATIAANQPTYQQAATAGNVPWQMIAVIHLRETGLSMTNPGNGQGLFQITSQHYPPGPVTPAEFLAEATAAAQFLHSIASDNYPPDQSLTSTTTDTNTIKDTFYSYNGRAYAAQAAQNGFDASTQAFEGSPYVMNKADAKRDPGALGPGETTWGQYKVDNGPISYPANPDYGAFVEYGAIAGVSSTGTSCNTTSATCSGPTTSAQGLSQARQNIVCIAEQEYAKWASGQLKPIDGYLTYSQGRHEEWCADFASWVYDQAKVPLRPDPNWNIAYVPNIQAVGMLNQTFHWHPAAGYSPTPGDLAIWGPNHVNIVVGVSGTKLTLIGGDEGPGPYPGGSGVYQDNYTDGITGYVSPD